MNEFKFEIIDLDTISVLCYTDGTTKILYRSNDSIFADDSNANENSNGTTVIGLYKLSGAMGYSLKEFAKLADMTEEEATEMIQIELKDNGVLALTFDGETEFGTWKLDGEELILVDGGEIITGTINTDGIEIELDGEILTFTKTG